MGYYTASIGLIMKILEFQTQPEALQVLIAVNLRAKEYWAEQGYTVYNDTQTPKLVGKNAATGKDEPAKQLTESWDKIRKSPDNTFYFTSLTGTRFEGAMDDLRAFAAANGITMVEKDYPQEWVADLKGE